MQPLLSIRFVATCAALVGLALVVAAFVDDQQGLSSSIVGSEPSVERRIDLVEAVVEIVTSDDFTVGDDGLTVGFADLVLAGDRVMRVPPGTPGELSCEPATRGAGCVVLADVLGDAVVWFALEERAPRDTVVLGPIVDLDDGDAVFGNGWRIAYAPVIERECANEDILSFSDFLRRFGPGSTSTIDLESQQVVSVECGDPVEDAFDGDPIGTAIGAYADATATFGESDEDVGPSDGAPDPQSQVDAVFTDDG